MLKAVALENFWPATRCPAKQSGVLLKQHAAGKLSNDVISAVRQGIAAAELLSGSEIVVFQSNCKMPAKHIHNSLDGFVHGAITADNTVQVQNNRTG